MELLRSCSVPLKVQDQERQSVSVGLRQITDVLIHQGDAVVVIGDLWKGTKARCQTRNERFNLCFHTLKCLQATKLNGKLKTEMKTLIIHPSLDLFYVKFTFCHDTKKIKNSSQVGDLPV